MIIDRSVFCGLSRTKGINWLMDTLCSL